MDLQKKLLLASLAAIASIASAAPPAAPELDRLIATQGCPGVITAQIDVDSVDGGFSSAKRPTPKSSSTLFLTLETVDYYEQYRGSEPTIFKPSSGPGKESRSWVSAGGELDTEAKFLICGYGLNGQKLVETKRELNLSVKSCVEAWKPRSPKHFFQEHYAYCQ